MDPTYAIAARNVFREAPSHKEKLEAFYDDNGCEFLLATRRSCELLAGLQKAAAAKLRAAVQSAPRGRKVPGAPV